MKLLPAIELIHRKSRQSKIHFSWFFLAFTLLWATLSVYFFSIDNFRAFNNTQQLPLDFPGNLEQWNITGDEHVFSLCGDAVCLNSAGNNKARIALDIPVENDYWPGVDQLLYEVKISETSNATPAKSATSPSFIVARARSAKGKNLRNLGSIITLEEHSQSLWRISPFHSQTAHLQLVFIVRSTMALRITDVLFYSIKLSTQYLFARALIFSGWIILLLLLALRVLSQFTQIAKVISATSFTLVLIIGASQYGARLTKQLNGFLGADWNTYLPGIVALSNNASLALAHVVFHLILTLFLARFSQPNTLTTCQIFAVNLSIAIGIECVQMGIPERSADIEDLAAAMFGMFVGLVLLLVTSLIGKTKPAKS